MRKKIPVFRLIVSFYCDRLFTNCSQKATMMSVISENVRNWLRFPGLEFVIKTVPWPTQINAPAMPIRTENI